MRYFRNIIKLVFFIFVLLLCTNSVLAAPGINKQINFQGKVTNTNGTNVVDGNYNFSFSIYSVASAGTSLWSETWNTGTTQVAVSSGIFNVDLGRFTSLSPNIDFNTDSLYLAVNFNGDGDMSPRMRLTSVPYALNAEKVSGLTVTNTTGTLTVPNNKTISFADAFSVTGAYSVTISSTASTGITLPTTGILATLNGLETFTNKTLTSSTINGSTGLLFSGSGTDVDTAVGEGLLLQGRADSTFQTTSGRIYLQPGGASVNGYVQIGTGTGSSTPDYLVLDNGSSEPGGINGAMYYNSSLGKFRCYTAGAWGDCGGGASLTGGNAMTAIGGTLDLGGLVTKDTRFNIGGTEVMFFKYSNGSVGIGTTTVAGAKVNIAGNLKLSVGNGSTVPSFLILDSTASEPVSGVEGAMYYHSGSNQFRCFRSGAWGNCATTTLSGIAIGAGVADNWANNNAGVWVNTTGSGDLIKAQQSGEDKFVVGNAGNITISATGSNLVKTTTGTTKDYDFSLVGSTMVNVGSTGDYIYINDGTIPASGQGIMSVSSVVTSANVGAGGQMIFRDDGKYLIIHGGGTTTASIWDGVSNTMTLRTISGGQTNVGLGSISLKRPDKRYLLIHGAGTSATSIFDPMGVNGNIVGPVVCGGGISSGTNAFMRTDGKYVIICGGRTNWGTYDPVTNAYAAGSAVGQAFGAGAHALLRDDGTFLVFRGAGTTQHWIYTPNGTTTGTMTVNLLAGVSVPTITTGAFSVRRNDGKYLILPGAINTSNIYNPSDGTYGSFTAQSGAGYGPTVALGEGAQTMWRQDGKQVLIIGNGSNVTNIINQSVTTNQQFLAGPSLTANAGLGVISAMRPNGQYQIFLGNSNTTTNTYNSGFTIGGNGSGSELAYYETECMASDSINSNSTLTWNNSSEGSLTYQVRTGNGSCSSSYRTIDKSGGLIGALSTDNRVQVRIYMKRDLPKFADQEWGLRKGGMTKYRRTNKDPAVYDFSIDNSSMVHKNQFDFANSNDASGPVLQNLRNDVDKGLALAMMVPNGSINASDPQLYNGTFGRITNLNTGAGPGTLVIKKPDNTYVVIAGSAPANAQYFNPITQIFTNGTGTSIPTNGTGLGALAVKRPDGKFLVVMGNGLNTTNIFDPQLNTFVAGPNLTAAAGRGALTIPLPTGRILIMHGNFTATSSIYDPIRNTMIAGPSSTAVVGGGAMALPRPNGTYLFVPGMATEACTAANTTTNSFDPYTMIFTATGSPTLSSGGVGHGAFAFQRSDGLFVIGAGATTTTCAGRTTTILYNPISNTILAGPAMTAAAQKGAQPLPLPNGNWLVMLGGGTTRTVLYEEKSGAFTTGGINSVGNYVAGPNLISPVGDGAVALQKSDGKFLVINGTGTTVSGAGSTAVHEYDGLWASSGFYRSEQINVEDLDANSTLSWKASPSADVVSAEVKTALSQAALQTASGREIPTSGGMVSPAAGETWLQISFNFRRSFPSYSGVYTDTWYNGGTPLVATYRNIVTPTLNEYKVTKSTNLIDLKSDGMSMFRVSSNGSVFASSGGVINTGGADLAENYSSVEKLEKGTVVSIDPINDHSVKKSNYQYQSDLLGVVSSDPGFVAGSYTEDSYPIALVGRVPVLVTTENGELKVGDKITSSSLSGYAMRATKSGKILGEALESLTEENSFDCPAGGIYYPNKKCGKIMMFVNLTDYNGEKVSVLMEESGFNSNWIVKNKDFDNQEKILSFLKQQRDEASKSAQYESEVYSDNIYATNQIVAPAIFTDLLHAKKIKADSIEGMEILTDKISSLSAEIDKQNTPISFFKSLVEFWNNVIFKGSVKFESNPEFNQNTAGFAIINKYSDSIDVKFDTNFGVTPIVNITLEGDAPLGSGYAFMVTNRNEDGFTIKLNRLADENIKFSWIALAVKDPRTFQMPTPTPMITVEEVITVPEESSESSQIIITPIPTIFEELPINDEVGITTTQNY